MTDRELLELAAKAAGLKVRPYCGGLVHVGEDGLDAGWWNPLTDDGDALRLAVKLSLGVMSAKHTGQTCVWEYCMGRDHEQHVSHDGDPYAATRRAIVRAAAEIGRA